MISVVTCDKVTTKNLLSHYSITFVLKLFIINIHRSIILYAAIRDFSYFFHINVEIYIRLVNF